MTTHANECRALAETIVDYADGELSQPERQAVQSHLAACSECRNRLADLHRSLALARAVWSDPGQPRLRWRIGRLAAAAGLVLAVGLGAILLAHRHGESTESQPIARRPAVSLTVAEELAAVERTIAREEAVARQAKALMLLARDPDRRCLAAAGLHNLSVTYADTATGRALRRPTVSESRNPKGDNR